MRIFIDDGHMGIRKWERKKPGEFIIVLPDPPAFIKFIEELLTQFQFQQYAMDGARRTFFITTKRRKVIEQELQK